MKEELFGLSSGRCCGIDIFCGSITHGGAVDCCIVATAGARDFVYRALELQSWTKIKGLTEDLFSRIYLFQIT